VLDAIYGICDKVQRLKSNGIRYHYPESTNKELKVKKQIFTVITLALLPLTTFADIGACNNQNVHCSHFDNASFPKYIKVEESINGHPQKPYIICADSRTTITIDKYEMDAGIYSVGSQISVKYYECQYKDCKSSIRVGEESFYLMKNADDDYYSDPYRYGVFLNAGYGELCGDVVNNRRIKSA
jgi:hypothetical protein